MDLRLNFGSLLLFVFFISLQGYGQLIQYTKKAEVYSERDNVRLFNKSDKGSIGTFNHNQHTSALYDVVNVDGGIIVRNRWTVNFYDDQLNKIKEFKLYDGAKSYRLGKTYMRKEGDVIYVIRIIGAEKRPDEFKIVKFFILPINENVSLYEEIEVELPHFLKMNSFDCEMEGNTMVGIGKKPFQDQYYMMQIKLPTGALRYERIELPTTNANIMSEESHKPWSHLFHKKDYFWLYEFYTTPLKDNLRNIVTHVVQVDMDGVILKEHTFNLEPLTAEMAELYSFAPGLIFDERTERIFVIGPSEPLADTAEHNGYLYFMTYDLKTGSVKKSSIINASAMVNHIPEDYKFSGLKTITSDTDPTQLSASVPKLRPLYYDPVNNSILIDFFYGNTGFGSKNEIKFKKFRMILNENGQLYRFGIIDDYATYFQHQRHIKYIEPEGFRSQYWFVPDRPEELTYKTSGYDLLTDKICREFPRCPPLVGTVVHKDGYDILVVIEEFQFRTTLYIP